MGKWRWLAGALAVGAWVALSASPASAETLTAGCETPARYERLTAWAYYTQSDAFHAWYEFQYRLDGLDLGDKNNVNIWIYQNSNVVWDYRSPDSLTPNEVHTLTLDSPVFTYGGFAEWTKFQGIFDLRLSGDPHCYGRTQPI